MFMTSEFIIETDGAHNTGRCECCGNFSRAVWGYADRNGDAYAVYWVHWTRNHVLDHGANFDIILGEWGEDSSSSDRYAVSLEYRVLESGPAVMVIDSSRREFSQDDRADTALDRDDIIGSPFAQDVFDLYDAIMAQDERLKEILCCWIVGEQ